MKPMEVRNNWGRLEFFLDGVLLTPETTRLYVEWPDGECTKEDVVWRQVLVDLGHEGRFHEWRPFMLVKVHGATCRVGLGKKGLRFQR